MNPKKIFFTFLFLNLLFTIGAYSQKYNSVDSIVDGYSKNINHTDQLVGLINKDFSLQDQKVRAVYRWIATNVSYDINLSELIDSRGVNAFSYKTEKEKEIKEKKFKLDLVSSAMTSRKAVCHGYSALVENLCLKLGIETKIIYGNLKSNPSQIGKLPVVVNHAWNVVKIDGKWCFIDVTLGAGYISSKTNLFKFYYNDSYFFTSPERFFLNHYPSDEKWLLVANNKNDFAQLPLFFGAYFQYNYQLIKPESGIFLLNKNENLIFAIKGLEQYDTVEYSTSIDNKITYLEQENNTLDYSIPLAGKRDSYVSIYVNRKLIAIYKVI